MSDDAYLSGSCTRMDGRNLYKALSYCLIISVSRFNKDVLVFAVTSGSARLFPLTKYLSCPAATCRPGTLTVQRGPGRQRERKYLNVKRKNHSTHHTSMMTSRVKGIKMSRFPPAEDESRGRSG